MKKRIVAMLLLTLMLIGATAHAATYGQQNALSRAQSYLSFTAFSRQGLIEQLEYEGFTHSQAVYGSQMAGF